MHRTRGSGTTAACFGLNVDAFLQTVMQHSRTHWRMRCARCALPPWPLPQHAREGRARRHQLMLSNHHAVHAVLLPLRCHSMREKDVPIDMLELPNKSEKIVQLAWEPKVRPS